MRGRPVTGGPRRTLRWASIVIVTVSAMAAAGIVLAPVVVRVFVQAFGLVARGALWLATSAGRGDDSWTIAAAVGRGLTTALVSPSALGVIGGLLLVGAIALFGLQRLLDSEEQEE